MSISSFLISKVAIWRNPLGVEGNWLKDLKRDKSFPSSTKIFFAQVGFAVAAVAAIVESIAYGLLFLASYPLTWLGIDAPKKLFAEKLESSRFAILWSLALLTGYNSSFANLLTSEASARNCSGSKGTASRVQQGKPIHLRTSLR
jgi:hypothetical protein